MNKTPFRTSLAGAAGAAALLFTTLLPPATMAGAAWSAWQTCGNSVSVSFSQVDSSTWTWKFHNDGPTTITYLDFYYTDSTGQHSDVFPGSLSPGQAFGGWAAFTSIGSSAPVIQLNTVRAGNSPAAAGNGPPQPPPPQPAALSPQQRQQLSAAQQHLASAQAYQAAGQAVSASLQADLSAALTDSGDESADATFHDELAPYGTWLDLDGQAYWQPREAAPGGEWRPYCQGGHWVYTEDGWTWDSEYQWGWAAFHYGRWLQHAGRGWMWQPDRVWGPAWVSWRGNDACCGWAPLPPGSRYEMGVGFRYRGVLVELDFDFGLGPDSFCFINVADICNPGYAGVLLPRARAAAEFRRAQVIREAYGHRGDRLVNAGVAVARVRQLTGKELKPLRIAEAGSAGEGSGRRSGVSGGALVVYRPKMNEPAAPGRPGSQSPRRANQVMDDLLSTGPAARRPAPESPRRASGVIDDLLAKERATPAPTQGTPRNAAGVMGDLLARGHDAPPAQGSPRRASDVMGDLLSGGHAAAKPAPAPARPADGVIGDLLARGHDLPSPAAQPRRPTPDGQVSYRPAAQGNGAGTQDPQPGRQPVAQTAYLPPRETARQPAMSQPAQTWQPPQQGLQVQEQRQRESQPQAAQEQREPQQQQAQQQREHQQQQAQQQAQEQRERQQQQAQEQRERQQQAQQQAQEQRERQQQQAQEQRERQQQQAEAQREREREHQQQLEEQRERERQKKK